MGPAAIIPIAIQLAQFAPAILRYFGVGENNVQVAEKVIETAQIVTGTLKPEAAIEALKASSELQMQFQDRILDRQQELERLYYADVADARKRDAAIRVAGQRNYRADSMYILSVIVVAIIFYAVWTKPDINEWIRGVVTLLLGRFLGYLDQIFNFEFGTTRTTQAERRISLLEQNGRR